MRYTSKAIILEYLGLIVEKSNLVISRNESIRHADDFLMSPDRMEKFDAACMLVQVIGETTKKIDDWTNKQLFYNYPEIYSLKSSRFIFLN